MKRRPLLGASLGLPGLAACRQEPTDAAPAPAAAAAPALPPERPGSPYRSQQRYLFQQLQQAELPSRLPGGQALPLDRYGPSADYVDAYCGWTWERRGGDWIDAKGLRWGSAPWFSLETVAPAPGQVGHEFVDATALAQAAQQQDRWCALLLRNSPGSTLKISGPLHPRLGGPQLSVVYADGERERLRARLVASVQPGRPQTAAPELMLPVFIEFERPRKAVREARLGLSLTAQTGQARARVEGFLLDPTHTLPAARDGLARAQAQRLDADLDQHPQVIGVHRYVDGSRFEDFVLNESINPWAEREFDPSIWDRGAPDTRKLPHKGLGRWVNISTPRSQWGLVDSGYRGEGFAPLTPGLGALRVHMPAAPNLHDGAIVGHGGTPGVNACIFMPEPLFGRLDRVFVRYYLRLGLTEPPQAAHDPKVRYQVYHGQEHAQTARNPVWTDRGGKFGIMPDHATSYGGVSGSSGGNKGWQMRLAWSECDAGNGSGPDEGGWRPGFHTYDFQNEQPVGHRYVNDRVEQSCWGQRDGVGGMLYAGQWYCIECELQLNHADPKGWRPDGALRAWVDGRLVFEREGMVFRTLPLHDPGFESGRIRPCRELGIRSLWFNWFHGGQTQNSIDRSLFVTGLAWGRDYLGPMKR
ncbi:hypothetical protein HNQ51_001552 [Inhella inkyongensis]|uniref:Uncharacterized protein n=1 Tax=Inhella inkyongensis TaxID=392593 RepID=A0A840S460_9BURK|nr:hypothetical protein [Inhella inkyongensis]MBB5204238.1 hypothetical protein [Inhella inkyongensis]